MNTTLNEENGRENGDGEHDPQFEPVITLPEVHIPTLEEDETVLHTARGKLFRLDSVEKEWKERGTGEAKLLYHKENNTVRMLMRRDRTLKLCANHYVTPDMVLKPNCGSDRAWLWSTPADAADGTPKVEILAIKFLNPDAARRWKDKFEEAKRLIGHCLSDSEQKEDEESSCSSNSDSEEDSEIMNKMKDISLEGSQKTKIEERNRENNKMKDLEEVNETQTKDEEDNTTRTKDEEDNKTKTKDGENNKTKTKDEENNKTKTQDGEEAEKI